MSEDGSSLCTDLKTKNPEKRKRKKKKYRKEKEECLLYAEDFLPVRLLTLFGMTLCMALFIFQIGTTLRSYEILHELVDEKLPDYMFGLSGEPNLWSWDPDRELLKVNTTLFIH